MVRSNMVSAPSLLPLFNFSTGLFHQGTVGKAVGLTYVYNKCAPIVYFFLFCS